MVCPHHELTIAHTEKTSIRTKVKDKSLNPGKDAVYMCAIKIREIITSN